MAGGATELKFPHSVELHGDSDLVIADHAGHRVQVCPLSSPGADCTTEEDSTVKELAKGNSFIPREQLSTAMATT